MLPLCCRLPVCSVNEVETVLSLYMCLTVLGTIFVLRKLGRVMGDKEHMAASEAALVKQVQRGGTRVMCCIM